MKRKYISVLAVLLLTVVFCGTNRMLRETIAERTFEIGFLEGFIFTMDVTANFLTGTLTAADIDVETEALKTWENSGILYVEGVCDSLGVVLDSTLENGLVGIYRIAFSFGIQEGERYISENILGEGQEEELDEQELAKALFEENRWELLPLIEGIKLVRKPSSDILD